MSGTARATTDEGRLVEAALAGDQRAFGTLFDQWFDRVHDLARRIVRDQGTASEVAQDTFLTAWTRLATLTDPDAFGGWLLRIARNKALNRLSRDKRNVSTDDETMTTLTDSEQSDHDPLAAMDQAARVELVWQAAAALGPRDCSLLDLHLRHGLSPAELAEELGTTANNAHQMLHTLRKRLGTNVRALVLWRAGHPACDALRYTLTSAGLDHFDKAMVKTIDRHAQACDLCSRERSERLSPAALFGAAPFIAAPLLLKAQAASALEAAGVPMSGSVTADHPRGKSHSDRPGRGNSSRRAADRSGAGPGATGGATAGPGPEGFGEGFGGGFGGGEGEGFGSGGGDGEADVLSDAADETAAPPDEPKPRRRRKVAFFVLAAGLALLAGGWAIARGDKDRTQQLDTAPAVTGRTTLPDTSTTVAPRSSSTTTTEGGLVITEGSDPADGTLTFGVDPTDVTSPILTAPPNRPPAPGRPAVPPVTQPAPTVPATSQPLPPPTVSITTTTAYAGPAPTVLRFIARPTYTQCQKGWLWNVAWATQDADSVTVSSPTAAASSGPAQGSTQLCDYSALGKDKVFTIWAFGPGGTTSSTTIGKSTAIVP